MAAKISLSVRLLAGALIAAGLALWLGAQEVAPTGASAAPVTLLRIDGAIGPATGDYVVRGLEHAVEAGSPLVILELDTPGGLDTSMREIIQAILASPIPVVAYVSPQGARAASAGTYILYASHVAAMAPATNLGAATPVSIGGPAAPAAPADDGGDKPDSAPPEAANEPRTAEERKAVNDAVAYIRSLAERRGRNVDWAERAVRSAASLSARAALEDNVIDLIATDVEDLLAQLDGRRVMVGGTEVVLATAGLRIEVEEPDWRTELLSVISNPTVAYLLLLIGIYGLLFEGYNPGAVLPGVAGAISLLLALFALQILPVNYAGLALIVLGVLLMIGEFLVPSFGALGLGGVVAFVFGSVILIDSEQPGFGVSRLLLGTIATVGSAVLFGVIWLAMRTRQLPVVSGAEDMLRSTATALEDFATEGAVEIRGERWHARSAVPVRRSQRLRVTRIDSLVLYVEPLDSD